MREAFARLKKLALLWSLGKDASVMIHLAKAFFGRVPFPARHVDTGKKFPEMYAFRDRYAAEWQLDLRVEPCPPIETVGLTLPPAARPAARKSAASIEDILIELEQTKVQERAGRALDHRAGNLKGFTGIGNDYQPPERCELRLDTSTLSVREATGEIERILARSGILFDELVDIAANI